MGMWGHTGVHRSAVLPLPVQVWLRPGLRLPTSADCVHGWPGSWSLSLLLLSSLRRVHLNEKQEQSSLHA